MSQEERLRAQTLAVVFAMVVCANAGDLMLKRGMTEVGAVAFSAAGLVHSFSLTVVNPTIWTKMSVPHDGPAS